MTTQQDITDCASAMKLLRVQLTEDHLTVSGIQAARRVLHAYRADLPNDLGRDCDWLLEQLDAELLMRELDGANS